MVVLLLLVFNMLVHSSRRPNQNSDNVQMIPRVPLPLAIHNDHLHHGHHGRDLFSWLLPASLERFWRATRVRIRVRVAMAANMADVADNFPLVVLNQHRQSLHCRTVELHPTSESIQPMAIAWQTTRSAWPVLTLVQLDGPADTHAYHSLPYSNPHLACLGCLDHQHSSCAVSGTKADPLLGPIQFRSPCPSFVWP